VSFLDHKLRDNGGIPATGETAVSHRARLLVGNCQQNTHLLYATQFYSISPLIYIEEIATGETTLFVPSLDYARACTQARVNEVVEIQRQDVPFRTSAFLVQILKKGHYDTVLVPGDFPLILANRLTEAGISLLVDEGAFYLKRAVKTAEEIEKIRQVVHATERALEAAKRMLVSSPLCGQALMFDGQILTTACLARQIERILLEEECYVCTLQVSTGSDTANPHGNDDHPVLAGEPVIMDVAAFHKMTHYHADLTRTFVRGTASLAVQEFYQTVRMAQEDALTMLRAGVSAQAVYLKVRARFERQGFAASPLASGVKGIFNHALGHGIGLSMHEYPPLGMLDIPLQAGHVLCIEPALYASQVGGVRIEDVVAVTETGYLALSTPVNAFML
jgi:Xaa-Pro aminopeptidase